LVESKEFKKLTAEAQRTQRKAEKEK
jgi:hypothetical protein